MIRIHSYIAHLYGKEKAQEIQDELEKYLETLPKGKYRDEPLWYKSANVYVVYPDVIGGNQTHPLDDLIAFLPHIKDTGFSALHILPFLDSPMKDRGFDVRDYYTVRKSLGTMRDITRLHDKARELGLRIFMDLIFNHVSNEHEWFQKAIHGNKTYRDYFIHTGKKPQFIRKIHKKSAVWAEYLVNGQKKLVNIAFPEFAGKIPHWIHARDGFWYYHTYRPDQLDINWKNPDVFLECAKILIFWASKGFHFRLDAIPFVGKSAYKQINSKANFTHHLLAGLNHLAKQVNPECVFILETYEHIDTVIGYLGKQNVQQAELLYGFHLCTALWVSLVEGSTHHLWTTLKKIQKIPTFAQWINFLRNHDELSLAYLGTQALHETREALLPYGKKFREGYGVAGRTFSLLGENKNRFFMAYFLLFSMPGGILMPYGDEFGKKNTPESHMSKKELADPRNTNRGTLSHEFLSSNTDNEIYLKMATMVQTRQKIRPYFNVWPERLTSSDSVFYASYSIGNSELRTLVNISDKERKISHKTEGCTKVLSVNEVTIGKEEIILGPYAGVWLQK